MSSDSIQRETAAFICIHVFAATHPVLLVAREQGDWMFLCGGIHRGDDDYRVAGRNHLLDADATLCDVMNLENGWEAERKFVGGPWARRAIED
jgi:hypothetical protein